jgi:hypothetical protein
MIMIMTMTVNDEQIKNLENQKQKIMNIYINKIPNSKFIKIKLSIHAKMINEGFSKQMVRNNIKKESSLYPNKQQLKSQSQSHPSNQCF